MIGTLSACGALWQRAQAEVPGTSRGGTCGCLLKISVLSKGEKRNRTSEREVVVVGGGCWIEARRERELQELQRKRQRDREMG